MANDLADHRQPASFGFLRAATGIEAETIGPNDFGKLLGLCDEMSPRLTNGTPWLREVKGYYSVVAKLEKKLPINPASRFRLGGFRDEDLFALCRGGSRPKSCARSRSTSGSSFGIESQSAARDWLTSRFSLFFPRSSQQTIDIK